MKEKLKKMGVHKKDDPKIPFKILVGMRQKNKERKQKEKEKNRELGLLKPKKKKK